MTSRSSTTAAGTRVRRRPDCLPPWARRRPGPLGAAAACPPGARIPWVRRRPTHERAYWRAFPNPSGLGNGGVWGGGGGWGQGDGGGGGGGVREGQVTAVQAAPAANLGSLTASQHDFAQHQEPTATVTVIYLGASIGAAEVISRPYS